MTMRSPQRLFEKIMFDAIEPGIYFSDKGALRSAFSFPRGRALSNVVFGAKSIEYRGSSRLVRSRVKEPEKEPPIMRGVPEEPVPETLEEDVFADAEVCELCGVADDELVLMAADYSSDLCSFEAADTGSQKSNASSALPDAVQTLEKILSSAYSAPVRITRVRDLPQSRKKVREVFFLINNGISKVWVFKADPEKTKDELNAYHIIHQSGIPTGKPIGYTPSVKQYEFDIAILGGIIEHAGEQYNELLQNMVLTPEHIFQTALSIADLIAQYQVKLTLAKGEFERYGVKLEKTSPAKEIRQRLLACLNVDNADDLIQACEELYNKQAGDFVVSHGDIHTGNIVTQLEQDTNTGLTKTSIKRFGVIDWGSLVIDKPYADVVDFWLHHERQAQKLCSYSFDIDMVRPAYEQKLACMSRDFVHGFNAGTKTDSVIQSALWNLYEMYDPVRTYSRDIEKKAERHCAQLMDCLHYLEGCSFREQSYKIKTALARLLADKDYLKKYLQ
jgi:hypothetical protein